MQISFHEKNLTLNANQKEYITDKIEALGTYGERIDDESTQVRVDVETNKNKTTDKNITVQVTMYVPHAVIRAEVFSTTVEEGVDLAEEKLRKQIERYKGKISRRDKAGKWIPTSTLEEITATQEVTPEVTQAERISKRKTYELDPIHEEEAIEQLELVAHDFFAFLNIDTNRFNIVYKREDGSYGLLDYGLKRDSLV